MLRCSTTQGVQSSRVTEGKKLSDLEVSCFTKVPGFGPWVLCGNTGLYLAQVLSDHQTYRQCPQVKMLTLEIIQWSLVVKASSVSMADWDCSWMLDRNTRCRIGVPCSSKSPSFARADHRTSTHIHRSPRTALNSLLSPYLHPNPVPSHFLSLFPEPLKKIKPVDCGGAYF